MIDFNSVKKAAIGKSEILLDGFGIEVPDDPQKHGPCPICGAGNNSHRFRFDDKENRGTWICNQCGSGDIWSLIQLSQGIDFKAMMEQAAEFLGVDEKYKGIPGRSDVEESAKRKKCLIELWLASSPLSGSDMASQYLHSRGLVLTPQNVRFCAKCYNTETKSKIPAMVALVTNISGKGVSIHRTYLEGPKKAAIETVKKMMPPTEKLRGSAIRLFPIESDTLGVCEGIETAIAARQIYDIPVWATTGTALLQSFEPPQEARKIIVFSDNDSNYAGQKAAYTLANRLYNKDFIVDVQVPPLGDFADIIEHEMKKRLVS